MRRQYGTHQILTVLTVQVCDNLISKPAKPTMHRQELYNAFHA